MSSRTERRTGAGRTDAAESCREPSEDLDHASVRCRRMWRRSGCSLSGSILDVDFSGHVPMDIGTDPGEACRGQRSYRSLVQDRSGINAVRFTIEGRAACGQAATCTVTGLMNADDFVGNSELVPKLLSDGHADALFLPMRTGTELVEQNVTVRYSSNVSKDKLIVEKLMQGPAGEQRQARRSIPDADLLSVTTKDQDLLCEF